MKIIRIIIFFLVITAICGCGNSAFADTAGAIRVGIYDNKPKIFVTDDGKASGFWPDIIEYIGSKENWNIEYVYGTWEECMSRLETGEIDVMPDVAYSEERAGL
ncbi:MAG: transporter substrate-binding domain-containing protein, partial [Dehalococcoidales bacterium]|nr:transporter substrate-binding domain-containing protein [Dehalococcoidales bacterium]